MIRFLTKISLQFIAHVKNCAKICSDRFVHTWVRTKWNCNHIWIVMKNMLVKWVSGPMRDGISSRHDDVIKWKHVPRYQCQVPVTHLKKGHPYILSADVRSPNALKWLDLICWGRMTHICVSKLTNIGPDNGLSPGRRLAIIWTNAGMLLIRTLGINFSEIHTF